MLAPLKVVFNHREPIAAVLLLIAGGLAAGLRPGLPAVAPGLAVEVAWARREVDPWGRRFLSAPPPWYENGGSLATYSVGPNGTDESVYFDHMERLPATLPGPIMVMEADGSPMRVGRSPDAPLKFVRLASDGVTPLTSAQATQVENARAAASAQLFHDFAARSAAGPKGDDVFVTFSESCVVRALANHPVEHWVGLAGLVAAWILGSRPRAPRHPWLLVEGLRVALLASVPALGLGVILDRAVRILGMEQLPLPTAVPFDTATYASAALVAVLMAVAVRGHAARSTVT